MNSGSSPGLSDMREHSLSHVNSIIQQSAIKPPASAATHDGTSDGMIIKSYPLHFLNVLIKVMKQSEIS